MTMTPINGKKADLRRGSDLSCHPKVSNNIADWNAAEEGTEILTATKRELHTSPVCLWIPAGGENGTLLVNAEYGNKGHNELFVSYDYGQTYSLMASPFRYQNKQGFGYSPAMVYDGEAKAIYWMNTVDYKGELSKIQFVCLGV